ncbi:hypothetical protein [Streptomyces sp. E5N91]|uniref:hypothetical protein n=1 Tax=Streptomyces sp. E5N91 TaxID=1851996 RepID=UPI000EF5E774|nr:hypothetical protein [Streptomyces sp. E5N91]
MELQADKDGYWWVTGVVANANVWAPLGEEKFQVRSHYVGFDQRLSEPITMRAYFDPTVDPDVKREHSNPFRQRLSTIGYMQTMRVEYAGIPIPPDVFGGRVADRWPYITEDGWFIDFMGPAEAWACDLRQVPFYAYNGLLSDDKLSLDTDFFRHGLPNGSLFSTRAVFTDGSQSRCASIQAEVAPGLLTPEDVSHALMRENRILTLKPTAAQIQNFESYQLALTALRSQPLPEAAPGEGPPLASLTDDLAARIRARAVGQYVLLTLPDVTMPDTLCVSTRPDSTIDVHLLTVYEMDDIWHGVGLAALWRISDYLDSIGSPRPTAAPRLATGRRKRPLRGEPPIAQEATDPMCKLRYRTVAFGIRNRPRGGSSRMVLNGFSWAAVYRYDRDSDRLDLAAIEKPQPLPTFDIEPGIQAFSEAIEDEELREHSIDPGIFTAAALRRDIFRPAQEEKVPYVDPSTGMDIG